MKGIAGPRAAMAAMLALGATPASADLPQPVRAMLNAAIAAGNEEDIAAVARTAKLTNPDDAAEIDGILDSHRQAITQATLERKRAARFFEQWRGSGELGGFLTTGSTDSAGLSAGLTVTKEGIRLRHKVRLSADYQRSDGVTTRDQWLASYEPNVQLSDGFYLFGLSMYEKDRFQGFSDRATLSGGFGYRVIGSPRLTIDIKGGPAWRGTDWIDQPDSSEVQGLAGSDLLWHISQGIDFSNNVQAVWGSENSTLANTAALTAKIGGPFSARLSYGLNHESNQPTGISTTDTITRATLVYGF